MYLFGGTSQNLRSSIILFVSDSLMKTLKWPICFLFIFRRYSKKNFEQAEQNRFSLGMVGGEKNNTEMVATSGANLLS